MMYVGFRSRKKTLKRHGKAERIVTDGLKSYSSAIRELGNIDRWEMGRWLNNRVENSHWHFDDESERCYDFDR